VKFVVKILFLQVSFLSIFALAQQNIPQVQHVIIVIQENRTPTNLFHEDQSLIANGAHVKPTPDSGACHDKQIPLTGMVLSEFCADPDHSHVPAWEQTCDADPISGQCRMDGACDTSAFQHCAPVLNYLPQYTYALNNKYDKVNGILDPYFHIAESYGFANWMFQTNQGPSFPAHQFLFSGTSAPVFFNDPGDTHQYWEWFAAENPLPNGEDAGCTAAMTQHVLEVSPVKGQPESRGYNEGYPCYDHNTLTTLLDNANPPISWRYYAAQKGFAIWNAPAGIKDICQPGTSASNPDAGVSQVRCTGQDWINDVDTGNPGDVLRDLGAEKGKPCNLRHVSWVIPDGAWSDHPGIGPTDAGPSWVASIVNAVGGYDNSGNLLPNQCGYWQNTVVLITWDDWGGFYDDVPPPDCAASGCTGYSNLTGSQYVYGFRVPLLVVSTYAKPAYISGGFGQGEFAPYIHDFGSILNFIEYAFGENGKPLGGFGGISPEYQYADYLAPDAYPNCNSQTVCPYSLSDFFTFNRQNPFVKITGAEYPTSFFLNPGKHFANYPEAPDDDDVE
jgi:hypothetical protein